MRDGLLLAALIGGVLLYCLSFLLALFQKSKKAEYLCLLAGELCNIAVVLSNYFQNGYVPFVSMFQVLTFLALCFLPVGVYIAWVSGFEKCRPYFSLAAAIVLCAPIFMREGAVWSFPPALQSPWFVPHILLYMLAYSLGTVCFLMTVVYLIGKRRDTGLYGAICCCARTAFPFMTAGMLIGAVWADQVWGAFWSWDLKECWSLITWLFYMLLLHCACRKKLRKFVPILSILGFCGILVTMFFVTGMVKAGGGSSMHVYSM